MWASGRPAHGHHESPACVDSDWAVLEEAAPSRGQPRAAGEDQRVLPRWRGPWGCGYRRLCHEGPRALGHPHLQRCVWREEPPPPPALLLTERRAGSDGGSDTSHGRLTLTGLTAGSLQASMDCGAAARPEKLLAAHAVLCAQGSARAQQMPFRKGDLGKPSDVCEVRCARRVRTRRGQAWVRTPPGAQGAVRRPLPPAPHPALPPRPGSSSQLRGSWGQAAGAQSPVRRGAGAAHPILS